MIGAVAFWGIVAYNGIIFAYNLLSYFFRLSRYVKIGVDDVSP